MSKATGKLIVRLKNNMLEIGIGASETTEQTSKIVKLDKVKQYTLNFVPTTYGEQQKLKSIYKCSKSLINKLAGKIKNIDISISGNKTIARDKLIVYINDNKKDFQCVGIEERKHTTTGKIKLFLNYGLNYYLCNNSTGSYSVFLKNEGFVPTGRTYHSNYLDGDTTHSMKNFDEIDTRQVVTDGSIAVVGPTDNDIQIINAEMMDDLITAELISDDGVIEVPEAIKTALA